MDRVKEAMFDDDYYANWRQRALMDHAASRDPDEDEDEDDSDLDPDATPLEDVVRIWYEPQEGGGS